MRNLNVTMTQHEQEVDLILNYIKIEYYGDWPDIFYIADHIERNEGYVLVMQHNTFFFKNIITGDQVPVQNYFSVDDPFGRLNAAHECIVKMIKYINSLK